MRMKSLILIFIALGCGLVASIGISQVMDRGGNTSTVETEQILVALHDIDINTKLDAQNVKLEDWPKAKIPEGAIRRLEDVKDKFASSRFYKGEPLHATKVSDMLNNAATKIPPGYRAMPVKVEEDTVMKAIGPGDRVDVLVFLRRNPPEISETGSFPLLRNVRVFATNTNTERAADAKGETTNFRTVSLLVKEAHAGELVVASKMGNLFLTLRHPDDADSSDGEEVTPIKDILSGGSKLGSDPAPTATPNNNLDFLRSAPVADAPPPALPAAEPAVKPVHTLVIMDPTGRKQFQWTDANGLPTQSTLSTNAPLPSAPAAPTTPDSEPTPATPAPEGQNQTDDAATTKAANRGY
jgi:pilus assembly protein CpaB